MLWYYVSTLFLKFLFLLPVFLVVRWHGRGYNWLGLGVGDEYDRKLGGMCLYGIW